MLSKILEKLAPSTPQELKSKIEIFKYIHTLYEIDIVRNVTKDIDFPTARRCAKALYGLTLDDPKQQQDFMNNHAPVILDFRYKGFAQSMIDISDKFIKHIVKNTQYNSLPLTEVVYNHLSHTFLNPTSSKQGIQELMFTDKYLHTKGMVKGMMKLEDFDIQTLEYELINLIASIKYMKSTEFTSCLTPSQEDFLSIYNDLIRSYLTLDRLAVSADFSRLRIASILNKICYLLYYPRDMKVGVHHELYEQYIEKDIYFKYVINGTQSEQRDHYTVTKNMIVMYEAEMKSN